MSWMDDYLRDDPGHPLGPGMPTGSTLRQDVWVPGREPHDAVDDDDGETNAAVS